MLLLYNLLLQCYFIAIKIAAFFHFSKAEKWIDGRKSVFKDIAQKIDKNADNIWIHCASLGEFEQGRPLIEQLKRKSPSCKILLTFFSPSGYETRKNYPLADYVFYLPGDTPKNAKHFIELVQPKLAVFVKYEFWYHYLMILHQKDITTILIAALFRPQQIFFRWYGGLFRKMLGCFTHFFVQNHASAQLLQDIGIDKYIISGDTRIDRVIQIAQEVPDFPLVKRFTGTSPIFIAGSTWSPDEAILTPFIKKNINTSWKYIIAPHDIQEKRILEIEKQLPGIAIRYSKAEKYDLDDCKVLIIDNIGILSSLYQYGRIAYIGGGFGTGIHNTLEALVFGLPIIFGPNYQKFEEAVQMVREFAAFSIKDETDFYAAFLKLQEDDVYKTAAEKAESFIQQNQGATDIIIDVLNSFLDKES